MSYYGGTITVQGRNLITSLIAGEKIEFTRILVGSGSMPDGVEPIDMTALVEPVAEAVSTVPVIENNILSMIVEYRNDLNGGLKKGFWLREFGIFARTENTEEILLYYATLGDSPQPVSAFKDNRIDIRRYPITIALELDADIQVSYNPGAFITSEDAKELIVTLVNEKLSGTGTEELKNSLEKVQTDLTDFKGTVNEAIESIRGMPRASIMQMDITIPSSGWEADNGGIYALHRDIAITEVTAELIPILTLLPESERTARACGMCTTARTLNGILRVYAAREPTADMLCSLVLLDVGGSGSAPQEKKFEAAAYTNVAFGSSPGNTGYWADTDAGHGAQVMAYADSPSIISGNLEVSEGAHSGTTFFAKIDQ